MVPAGAAGSNNLFQNFFRGPKYVWKHTFFKVGFRFLRVFLVPDCCISGLSVRSETMFKAMVNCLLRLLRQQVMIFHNGRELANDATAFNGEGSRLWRSLFFQVFFKRVARQDQKIYDGRRSAQRIACSWMAAEPSGELLQRLYENIPYKNHVAKTHHVRHTPCNKTYYMMSLLPTLLKKNLKIALKCSRERTISSIFLFSFS